MHHEIVTALLFHRGSANASASQQGEKSITNAISIGFYTFIRHVQSFSLKIQLSLHFVSWKYRIRIINIISGVEVKDNFLPAVQTVG
jgi:hypothetical protein